jgi:hypothetical protein
MKVLCVRLLDSHGRPQDKSDWLVVGKIYNVLQIIGEARQDWRVRIVGDKGNGPALFSLRQFDVVSKKIPPCWTINFDGENLSVGPESWHQLGFWEEYYNRIPAAIRDFEEGLQKIVSADP